MIKATPKAHRLKSVLLADRVSCFLRQDCGTYLTMRRLQAFILLLALVAGTGSVLAQATYNPTPDCCADGMCPMHRAQHSHSTSQSKSNCGGASGAMNCCAASCSGRPESPKMILSSVLEAVLRPTLELPVPQDIRNSVFSAFEPASTGFFTSPEQPPRQ